MRSPLLRELQGFAELNQEAFLEQIDQGLTNGLIANKATFPDDCRAELLLNNPVPSPKPFRTKHLQNPLRRLLQLSSFRRHVPAIQLADSQHRNAPGGYASTFV